MTRTVRVRRAAPVLLATAAATAVVAVPLPDSAAHGEGSTTGGNRTPAETSAAQEDAA